MRTRSSALAMAAVVAASAAFLSACAPVEPNLVKVGRSELQLPPGNWEYLGQGDDALFNVLPDDVSHDLPMRTQAVGLRGPQHEMLAVIIVQTNATNAPRDTTLWSQTCPDQKGVQVDDFAKGSPIRIDCLRFKRRADNEEFLTKNRPVLEKWVMQHNAMPSRRIRMCPTGMRLRKAAICWPKHWSTNACCGQKPWARMSS
ncbi:hypothetical protein [Diaphorobacter aerolatus]|uniref:hypothetical protein n=1 Tax=Diaphorobacter aerolatus TaxID=1288495 RepID=UPI001D006126|nr:hypothetical protein [Diaphorobacter aerolatus]